HLGDAGDRALVLRVLLPEHLAGRGIENDGRRGADIGHQFAVGVRLVPGRRGQRLLNGAHARDLARARRRAGSRQTGLACLRRRRRIRRFCRRAGGLGGGGRLGRRGLGGGGGLRLGGGDLGGGLLMGLGGRLGRQIGDRQAQQQC